MSLYSKIISTKRVIVPIDDIRQEIDSTIIKKDLQKKIKRLFHGSLAIRAVDGGSTNAEEQELTALANPYYDVERFGIHFVASPRHADMLMVTGPVSRNMETAIKKAYDAMPEPKIVVAVGDDAIDGGIFKGSYAVLDGLHNILPVNFQIPGDPPSPMQMLSSLLRILEIIEDNKDARR